MSQSVVSSLVALGSALFGWLLNESSQWLKGRRDDKKILKKTLYYLLETLYIFNKFNFSKDLDEFFEKGIEKFPEELKTNEAIKFIKHNCKEYISKILIADINTNFKNLEESYIKCLDELSLVQPIAAYRLRGKNNILNTFEYLNSYCDSISELSNNSPENEKLLKAHLENLIEILKPDVINDAINDLKEEIINISRKISLFTKMDVKKIINKASLSSSIKMDDFLEKMIPSLFLEINEVAP